MILTLDCETTTYAKGNPFSRRNKLCYIGIQCTDNYTDYSIEYSSNPYGVALDTIKTQLAAASVVVGFNLKFDLHWLRRYGITARCNLWDCQLAHFLLRHQKVPYPSLNQVAEFYGLGQKVELDWDSGADTTEIPEDLLREYLKQDVSLTYLVYQKQLEEFQNLPQLYELFKLQMEDLAVLQEMEYNGMLYDVSKSNEEAERCAQELKVIDDELNELAGSTNVNWASGDHVSAVLYGGTIAVPVRVPTSRVLKSGVVKQGEKWGLKFETFSQKVAPLKESETLPTKEWDDRELADRNIGREKPFFRVWSTNEGTLRTLKPRTSGGRRIVELILERHRVNKLYSTYYLGLPQLMVEKDWPNGMIYGQFNQVVAVTGRLSSTSPNLQNFVGDIKPLFYTRF